VSSRVGDRLVRAAVRAYPRAFRDHYAGEILLTLRDQRQSLPNATRARVAGFWARALLELLRSAARERAEDVRHRAASAATRRAARVVLGAGLALYASGNVIYDLSDPKANMGGLAILLTAASAVLGGCLLMSSAALPE
jgi:hypothetical protein